jgi:hypothetical protein
MPENDPSLDSFKLGDWLHVTLPRWMRTAVSILLILSALGYGGIKIFDHLEADKVRISPAALAQMQEAQKHLGEKPLTEVVLFEDGVRGSTVTVRLYKSDLCVAQERRGTGGLRSLHFNVDPDRLPPPPEADGQLHNARRGDGSTRQQGVSLAGLGLPLGGGCPNPTGRCVHPHAGNFQTWAGQRQGCWVQVWRRFGDCCQHYQWLNDCYNVWGDLHWTYCVH